MNNKQTQAFVSKEETLDMYLIQSAKAYRKGKLTDAYELYKKAKMLNPELAIVKPTNASDKVMVMWKTKAMQKFASWAEESIGELIDKTSQSDNLDLFATAH